MGPRKIGMIPIVILKCFLKIEWSQKVNGTGVWEPPDSRMVTLSEFPELVPKLRCS